MTLVETTFTDVDLRLASSRTARHEFHAQIARLEDELVAILGDLDPQRRPVRHADGKPRAPRMLSSAELEAVRDDLVARISDAKDLIARQAEDRSDAQALLKRMTDAPQHFRWASVTTTDLGADGCKTWQSLPVLGPIGMLGNWWRIRMSSGCP